MGGIVEMLIVLTAMAILTVQGIQTDLAHRRAQVFATEGQSEAAIVTALGEWANANYATLLAQYTADGESGMTQPTLADLVQGGFLKASYRAGPFWGGSYMITLAMTPAGCTQAAGNCSVSYTMYPDQPVMKGNQPDVAAASQIAQAGGANFGYSTMQKPATIGGINGAWTVPNPLDYPAIVLATNAPGLDGNSLYIRRDGSLSWTGDQDANGVSVNNVNNLNAQNVAAPAVSASDVSVTDAIRTPGTLNVENAAGTAPAPISTGNSTVNGTLNVSQAITPGAIATPRTWCPTNGAAATNSDGRGQWLSCQDNVWMPIGAPAARYGYYAVSNGAAVPAPACFQGGTPQIVVTPQTIDIDPTAAYNVETAGTGPWTVSITDNAGSALSGSVVVETYCAY